ncbi:MAG: thioredoxin domain-containing protein [Sphingomonas sp.]
MTVRFTFVMPVLALAACQQQSPTADTAAANEAAPAAVASNASAASPNAVAPSAPQGRDWASVVTRTPDNGYRMGNPAAPVTLVEFGSRTCPHCAAFAASGMQPLVEKYVRTGKVAYEFRDWLRDGGDVAAALIGRCKGTQGFFPLLTAEFEAQPEIFAKEASQTEAQADAVAKAAEKDQPYLLAQQIGYVDFAHAQGIDDAQARQCLSDVATAEAIGKMNARAKQDYALSGTPTFLINGKKVEATGWPELQSDIQAALTKAGA